MNPLRLYPILLTGLAAVAAVSTFWLYRRRKTPDERERDRRLWLATNGRIIDGTIIDVCELPSHDGHRQKPTGPSPAQMLIFHYDVAGVTYEASQDVTQLEEYVDPKNCRIGVPASIKYDPQNPGNSIVVAETWTGLRKSPPIRLGIMQDDSAVESREQ
jgi:hypothetical protein